MKGEREYFLDVLRIGAACAVVLLHTVTGVWDSVDMTAYPSQEKVFMILRDLVTWCVPMFLIISGYLFLRPGRQTGFVEMLTKYCRRIVLALFLFGVPFACMELIWQERSFSLKLLWQSVKLVLTGHSWAHMWYLYLILGLYVFTPALQRMVNRVPFSLVVVVEILLFFSSSFLHMWGKIRLWDWVAVFPEQGVYLFYYLAGFVLHKLPAKREHGGWYAVLTAGLILGMIGSRLAGFRMQMAYNYPFTLCLTILLFMTVRCLMSGRNPGKEEGAWEKILSLSKLSFAVYLIHPVFLNIEYKFLGINPLDYPLWLSLTGCFVVTMGGALLGARILRKSRWLCRFVL